ncbi:MAG: hypothetical protein ABFD08_11095 [Syntrophomonas sp.]
MAKGKSKKPVSKKRQWDWLFWLLTIAIVAVIVLAFRENSIPTNQAQNATTVQQPVSTNQAPASSNSDAPNVRVETPGADSSKFTVQTLPPNTQDSNGSQDAAPKQ